MPEQSLSLNSQVINGFFHPRNALLCASNQVFISYDLVDQLVLAHAIDLFLSICHVVFPLVEPAL